MAFILSIFKSSDSAVTRRISPDSAGAVDGLNLYVYVGNNPLKYRDPTELVAGLVGALGVVFAVFAEDVGADVQGVGLLLCFVN
jgi:hypothetical protein